MPDSTGRAPWLAATVAAVVALAGCTQPDELSQTATPSTPAEPTSAATTTDAEPSPSPSPTPSSTPDVQPTTTEAPTPAVRLASGPGELARRVVAAEATTRDPDTAPAELSAAAFEAQVLYRQLSVRPAWQAEVFDAVGDDLRPVVEAHVTAATRLRAMHTSLSDTLPAWRIVEPAAADELLSHHREAEDTFGVAWEVLAAVNLVETRMGRIRGVSTAGAQGPMQFMPATWDAFGEGDVNDPHDAIMAAARCPQRCRRRQPRPGPVPVQQLGPLRRGRQGLRRDHGRRPGHLPGIPPVAGGVPVHRRQRVGYHQDTRVPAAEYLAANPSHLVDHDGG